MAKVLVTGASGFIGLHLAEALVARGDEVTCLVRKTSEVDRLRLLEVRLVYGDVTDRSSLPPAVAGSQIVFQVAGCTRAFRAKKLYQVNQQGVRNLAQTCAEQTAPPVLVSVSSLAAAGPAPGGRLRAETDPLVQVSNYGRSKRAGERAAEEFADRVPTTVVRPPIVLGERDRTGLQMFKIVAQSGIHPVPGLGRARHSVIHAADLANLLILAAQGGTRLKPGGDENGPSSSQGYYFAACSEHPTYAELGRMIATALGRRRLLVVPTPPQMMWLVAAGNEIISRITRRPAYLNIDKVREARAGSWLCSAEAAVDGLGFSVAAPLVDRLRQTAQWYRKEGWL